MDFKHYKQVHAVWPNVRAGVGKCVARNIAPVSPLELVPTGITNREPRKEIPIYGDTLWKDGKPWIQRQWNNIADFQGGE